MENPINDIKVCYCCAKIARFNFYPDGHSEPIDLCEKCSTKIEYHIFNGYSRKNAHETFKNKLRRNHVKKIKTRLTPKRRKRRRY
jgi:hypothetical protein